MNAREFYEEFKAMLSFVGVRWGDMDQATVEVKDGHFVVTAGTRTARIAISEGEQNGT